MTTKPRRKFKSDFKAKVAIAAIKELQTIEEICKKIEVHPTQANLWKKEFLTNAAQLFDKENKQVNEEDQEKKLQELYAQIGQLKVENDFLKKKLK
jgi:transposase-like protein